MTFGRACLRTCLYRPSLSFQSLSANSCVWRARNAPRDFSMASQAECRVRVKVEMKDPNCDRVIASETLFDSKQLIASSYPLLHTFAFHLFA